MAQDAPKRRFLSLIFIIIIIIGQFVISSLRACMRFCFWRFIAGRRRNLLRHVGYCWLKSDHEGHVKAGFHSGEDIIDAPGSSSLARCHKFTTSTQTVVSHAGPLSLSFVINRALHGSPFCSFGHIRPLL